MATSCLFKRLRPLETLSYRCVLAGGMSERSVTLDDSVSEEEEEASFDELTDGTPYLQPGLEVSLLNEVRWAATGRGGGGYSHVPAFAEATVLL